MKKLLVHLGLNRRDFLSATSGGLVSALTGLACGDAASSSNGDTNSGGSTGTGTGGSTGTGTGGSTAENPASGGAVGTGGSGATPVGEGGAAGLGAGTGGAPATPTCGRFTAPNIEGPFFTPNSPERTNLRIENAPGVKLSISGRVYSASCEPLADALLDFWQADAAGAYDNRGSNYRGHQYTDAEGRYQLETIVPGRYLNGGTYRPAHIHVKAAGAGTMLLTTQLYFPGDPYNEGDPFIDDELIMSVSEGPNGLLIATFDFMLRAR